MFGDIQIRRHTEHFVRRSGGLRTRHPGIMPVMDDSTRAFGHTLQSIRKAHALSQKQVGLNYGRLINKPDGIYPSVVAGWESGATRASRRVVHLLASATRATDDERNQLLIGAGFLPNVAPDNLVESVRLALRRSEAVTPEDEETVLGIVQEIQERRRKNTL